MKQRELSKEAKPRLKVGDLAYDSVTKEYLFIMKVYLCPRQEWTYEMFVFKKNKQFFCEFARIVWIDPYVTRIASCG